MSTINQSLERSMRKTFFEPNFHPHTSNVDVEQRGLKPNTCTALTRTISQGKVS